MNRVEAMLAPRLASIQPDLRFGSATQVLLEEREEAILLFPGIERSKLGGQRGRFSLGPLRHRKGGGGQGAEAEDAPFECRDRGGQGLAHQVQEAASGDTVKRAVIMRQAQ